MEPRSLRAVVLLGHRENTRVVQVLGAPDIRVNVGAWFSCQSKRSEGLARWQDVTASDAFVPDVDISWSS